MGLILSLIHPPRPANPSHKSSRPPRAIGGNKTLEKSPKAAKPPRELRTTAVTRDGNLPAELESPTFLKTSSQWLDITNGPSDLANQETGPPKVNYGRKPTLQPQGAPVVWPTPLTTIPEQPLTPPPSPTGAMLPPPLPPRPPHAQQPSANPMPPPGSSSDLQDELGQPLVLEPSWAPTDAQRREVRQVKRRVKFLQLSYADYKDAVTALHLTESPKFHRHLRRVWTLFAGNSQSSLPLCSVAYLLRYTDNLGAGFVMPKTIPAEIRHGQHPIPGLEGDVRSQLEHLSSDGCLAWFHMLKGPLDQFQAQAFVRLCELSISIQGLLAFEGHWALISKLGIMSRLVESSTSDTLANLMVTFVHAWSLDILNGDLKNMDEEATLLEYFNQQIDERTQWLRALFVFLDNIELDTEYMTEKTKEILDKALELLHPPKRALLIYMWFRINSRWINTLIAKALYCFEPPEQHNPGHRTKGPGTYGRNREQRVSRLVSEFIRLALQEVPGYSCRPYLPSVCDILIKRFDILVPQNLDSTLVGCTFLDELVKYPSRLTRQFMMETVVWLDLEG